MNDMIVVESFQNLDTCTPLTLREWWCHKNVKLTSCCNPMGYLYMLSLYHMDILWVISLVPFYVFMYFCLFFLYLLCPSMICFLHCFHKFFIYVSEFRFFAHLDYKTRTGRQKKSKKIKYMRDLEYLFLS